MQNEIEAARQLFVPARDAEISVLQDGQSSAVAYLYDQNGVAYAAGFGGRRKKPDYHYRFRSPDSRHEHVQRHFRDVQAGEKRAAERRAARKAAGRGVEVGDILYTSWGYEQTNVEYYQVTKLVGKTMAVLRRIGANVEETGWMQGTCTPAPDSFTGPEIRRVVKDGSCTINSVVTAWKNKKNPDGSYHEKHWSSYY
ncbi:MAG: hypothetical protein OXC41_01850 [Gammaproteobacteria bacterium]|nr:hypothetical protein [Gammaproteobacteria bacterium]